jgi:hypothetical protein
LQHELKEKADEFYTVSSMPGKMFHGCVGAIDGWLTTINKPNVDNGDEIIYNRTIIDDDDGEDQPLPTTHLRDTILAQVIAMDLRRPD